MYETKIMVSPARAWERATPAQRRTWFPDGPPPGASAGLTGHGSGASWDTPPDPAGLERAKRAGMAARAAGYGQARADGLVPCTVCPACTAGYPEQCRHPSSKAAARHEAALARDADRTAAAVVVAELAMLHVELSAGLG